MATVSTSDTMQRAIGLLTWSRMLAHEPHRADELEAASLDLLTGLDVHGVATVLGGFICAFGYLADAYELACSDADVAGLLQFVSLRIAAEPPSIADTNVSGEEQ